jgi:hypothetical protein
MAYRFTSPQAARDCSWEREMKATKMVRYADDLVDAPRGWDRGSGPSNRWHSTDSMKRGQPTRSRPIGRKVWLRSTQSNFRGSPPYFLKPAVQLSTTLSYLLASTGSPKITLTIPGDGILDLAFLQPGH